MEQNIISRGPGTLPDRDRIIEISMQLRQLLFPGYFGKKDFNRNSRAHHVGELASNIFEALSGQNACPKALVRRARYR